METTKEAEPYTGIRREGGAWTIYFPGKVVGERVLFSQAQATLAEAVAADALPVQETTEREEPK